MIGADAGLAQRQFVIGRVQRGDKCAFLDRLTLSNGKRRDLAGYLERDLGCLRCLDPARQSANFRCGTRLHGHHADRADAGLHCLVLALALAGGVVACGERHASEQQDGSGGQFVESGHRESPVWDRIRCA